MEMNNPFRIKALVVYDGIDEENATARALRALKQDLEESDVVVEVSQCICDAELIVTADPTVQCVLVYLDGADDEKHRRIQHFLELLRSRNRDMPVFLMSNRTKASEIPAAILDKVNDFIWILEDTSDFISGRILAAVQRYREFILPPMFKALAEFSDVYEYSNSVHCLTIPVLSARARSIPPVFSAPTALTMLPTVRRRQTGLFSWPASSAIRWRSATATVTSRLNRRLPCPAPFRLT